jgi:CBS domain-containing protein
MKVQDVMSRHAEWISPDTTLVDVAKRFRDQEIGCLPIGQQDRLIGIVTDRDITRRAVAAGLDPKTTPVSTVMTKGIAWCYEDVDIDEAIQLMARREIHHLAVMNRSKRLVGVVTLSDLAQHGEAATFQQLSRLAARDAEHHQHLQQQRPPH